MIFFKLLLIVPAIVVILEAPSDPFRLFWGGLVWIICDFLFLILLIVDDFCYFLLSDFCIFLGLSITLTIKFVCIFRMHLGLILISGFWLLCFL